MTDIAKINGVAAASVGKHLGVASANIAKVGGTDFPNGFTYPYDVGNSCLFISGDSTRIMKTPGSNGNGILWSFSAWVKRSALGVRQTIFSSNGPGNGSVEFSFIATDELKFYDNYQGVTHWWVTSTAKFCDVGQWMHVLGVMDIANTTEALRMRLYVNGVEITDFSDTSYPVVTQASDHNQFGVPIAVGYYSHGGGYYFNGYLAECVSVDGQALIPSDFGVDTDGIWTPKDISGLSLGTNGFYLDFADSGNLGNDAGGGTDLTPTGMSTANQSTDTPTNNFCTLNPINPIQNQTGIVLTNGNLTATSSASYEGSLGTFMPNQGKWYWEVDVDAGDYSYVGISGGNVWRDDGVVVINSYKYIQLTAGDNYIPGNTVTFAASMIIGVAVDMDNKKVWFAQNGTQLQDSGGTTGNPSAGTNENYDFTGEFDDGFKPVVMSGTGHVQNCLFGGTDPTGTIASGNADDNGYGNFEYAPPTGFMALCSANLQDGAGADPVMDGFVFAAESDTAIVIAIEALRSEWTDWIDVFKCNTANSDWRVRFSDDPTNQLAFNLQDDKTTFVNPSGTSGTWEAWSWRVGAKYGCMTGTINHTNGGGDTTGAHGLGSTPEMCLAKPENQNGTNWYCYHQALTANNNILLNSNTAQTATEYIEVDSTNVTIKSAAPTGIYRYIAFAGVDGMSYFGSYEGNNNADGPFTNTDFSPAFTIQKNIDVGTTRWVYTSDSDGNGNALSSAVANSMYVDTNGFHTGGFAQDHVSNGHKVRINGAGDNYTNSLHTFIIMAWGVQPFKFANAR